MAISTLLISDALFRAKTVETRRKYVNLVEEAEKSSAKVHIFSSAHVSGEQLGKVTQISLSFPPSQS